jgi:hypothetical protein
VEPLAQVALELAFGGPSGGEAGAVFVGGAVDDVDEPDDTLQRANSSTGLEKSSRPYSRASGLEEVSG